MENKEFMDKFHYVCYKGQAMNFLEEYRQICEKYGLTLSCDDINCFPFVLSKFDDIFREELDMTIQNVKDTEIKDFLFFERSGLLVFDKYLSDIRKERLTEKE